jgi:hypothetical protein
VVKKIRTSRQRLDSAVGDNAERREVLQEESAIGEAFKLIAETKTAMTQMHAEQQVREDNEIAIEAHQPTDKYSRKKQRAKALTELNMEDHEIITSAGMRITQTTKEILAFAEKKKQQNIREKKQNKKLKPRTGYRQQRQTLTRNTTSPSRDREAGELIGTDTSGKEATTEHGPSSKENRHGRLLHGLRTERTGDTAKLLKPLEQQMPEGYPFIYDETLRGMRKCRDNEEILQATKDKHTKWTGGSGAKEELYFGHITHDDCGPNGISDPPDEYAEFTEDDLQNLLPNPDKYSEKLKERFMDMRTMANSATHSKTRASSERNSCGHSYADTETNSIHDDGIREDFWESIIQCTNKARHEDLHLTLFARLPDGPLVWLGLMTVLAHIMILGVESWSEKDENLMAWPGDMPPVTLMAALVPLLVLFLKLLQVTIVASRACKSRSLRVERYRRKHGIRNQAAKVIAFALALRMARR